MKTRRLAADLTEFTTLDARGQTVSTVRMPRTKAITLGIIAR
ncbi:hypothetical protein [Streptomyces sp. AJS327]|nr:hypothetical protein [Streptomyces sp. AJS327]